MGYLAVTVIIRSLKMNTMRLKRAANVIHRMRAMKKFRHSRTLFTNSVAAVTRPMVPDRLKRIVLRAMSGKWIIA